MPEGDTISRSARRLAAALVGESVTEVRAPRWAGAIPGPGETITDVRARGKHLRISFDGGLVLATHMKMSGSWHLYRHGERWQRPASTMRVVLGTPSWEAVCFSAPDVAFVVESRDRGTDHLGPDLSVAGVDLGACVERFDLLDPSLSVADALLDQRVCCGVGNVFKSEVCWALEVDPFTPVQRVTADLRRTVVATAATQLQANLDSGTRTTVRHGDGRPGLAVYGRTGQRCLRCGGTVRSRLHGPHARRTYWCPDCQTMGQ